MLRLIYGKSKSGKTTMVLNDAIEKAKQGKDVIIIVPEQASFDTEITLAKMDSGEYSRSIKVFTLTSLAGRIFSTLGGCAGKYISETGKLIAMTMAVASARLELKYFGSSAELDGFPQKIASLIDEIHSSGLDSEALGERLEEISDETLRNKLSDCVLVDEIYNSTIKSRFNDSSEILIRASKKLRERDIFKDYVFYIDGFMTFMAGEYEFINELLRQSSEMTITIPSDYETRNDQLFGGFYSANQNATKLITLAKRLGKTVALPQKADFKGGFSSSELSFLAENYESSEAKRFEKDISSDEESFCKLENAINIMECSDVLEELGYVASCIKHLTMEKGVKYNEIAVVARNISSYESYIEDAFNDCEIPLFFDKRKDIRFEAIALFILNSVNLALLRLKTEDILSLGKSPCLNISPSDLGRLQNYAYMWSIDGKAWESEFTSNVRGAKSEETDRDRDALNKLNETREKIISPILCLRERLKNASGREFVRAIYDYLEETRAIESLKAHYYHNKDKDEILKNNSDAYDAIISILEEIDLLVGDSVIPSQRLANLLENAINLVSTGDVPQMQDRVILGSSDRIRVKDKKYVFVLGANFGVFPPKIRSSYGFSDEELKKLEEKGITIGNTSVSKFLFEKYYAYFALTIPSEALFVSYVTHSLDGEKELPSEIISRLEALFSINVLKASKLPRSFFCVSREMLFEVYCSNINNLSPQLFAMESALSKLGYAPRLQKIKDAKKLRSFKLKDKQLGQRLFGDDISVSPSQAEGYFACPFSYFCKKGLGIRPVSRIEFSPLESGTIIHFVLEQILKNNSIEKFRELDDQKLGSICQSYLEDYLNTYFDPKDALTNRYHYLFNRLSGILQGVLINLREEFKLCQFVPKEFEMKIGLDSDFPPLKIKVRDKTNILVEGVVDRVDVYKNGSTSYIRVIDYKSGIKNFDLNSVVNGFDMQMLLYLLAVCQSYCKEENSQNIPAGVLYFPARDFSVLVDAEEKDPSQKVNKEFKRKGILLEDEESLNAMEKDIRGEFIPAKLNSKGDDFNRRESKLISRDDMDILLNFTKEKIKQLANGLLEGEFEAIPIKDKAKDPCKFCDYRLACGFTDNDKTREILDIKNEECISFMRSEVENND